MKKKVLKLLLFTIISFTLVGCVNSGKIDVDGDLFCINYDKYKGRDFNQLYNNILQEPDSIYYFPNDGLGEGIVISFDRELEIDVYLEKNSPSENINIIRQEFNKITGIRITKHINSKIGKRLIIYYKFD